MFEKSKRNLVAATRGSTYRVQDSSSSGTAARFSTGKLVGQVVPGFLGGGGGRNKNLWITVIFLDDSQYTFEIEKSAKGSVLLDKVFQHLELSERDYFGLQFDELLPPPEVTCALSSPHLRWIESSKPLKKQIRFSKPADKKVLATAGRNSVDGGAGSSSSSNNGGGLNGCQQQPGEQGQQAFTAVVYFRVKFFVDDPAKLNEEYTRYHVYLQLRKDILEGRLTLTRSMSCLLASYAVQSELGDYNVDEHDDDGNYLKNIESNLLLLRDPDALRKVVQLHQMHKGQTPADAEFNFLMNAKRLEAYGINFHRVKDNLGKEIEIGVCSVGISVFHNGIKMNTFSWSKITKIAFKRKNFFIQVRRELSEEYDTLLFFDCWSYRSCKRLWKACVEHHAFFRLSAPPPSNRRPTLTLFSLGSKFRYSGRTEYQTREESNEPRPRGKSGRGGGERKTFFRSPSKKLLFLRQTLTGRNKRRAAAEQRPDGGGSGSNSVSGSPAWNQRKELRVLDVCDDNRVNGESEMSDKKLHHHIQPQQQQQLHQGHLLHQQLVSSSVRHVEVVTTTNLNRNSVSRGSGPGLRTYDKVHQVGCDKEPRQAWADDTNSDDEGGFLDRNNGIGLLAGVKASPILTPSSNPIHISLLAKGIKFADDDSNSVSDDGTVSIRLEPDTQGKFGFNIKGGSDMGCPVLVSRVAPGTPADQGYPRLSEGDHLMQINGRDTCTMMHQDIVNSIRHAATVKKELMLKVRPNVYTSDDYEEPPFQYVPDVPLLHVPGENDYGIQSDLSSSMMLLAEAIESDSISNQFDLVFRRKPGMSCDVAKYPENLSKNRYRDISPYDVTRVILNSAPSGDYINASYVTMEIAASGIVNRYIACQGPLSSTTPDFWIMVWESQSPLIVMLTPICEHGRVKCHPYWPQNLNSPVVYHNLEITTVQEKNLPLWIHREFQIKNLETDEERVVVQLMYQSWPDHGVPDEPTTFIRFIEEVRKMRIGTVEPTVIHCSAGIGRTGVLILMETAECLIEANQPVYPVDIVTQMRLQRPLMIQTPSQYRFVCECVLRVFQKGMIRPLPEFCIQASASSPIPTHHQGQMATTSSLGSRARAFCSSWFHTSLQQQQLHSGA